MDPSKLVSEPEYLSPGEMEYPDGLSHSPIHRLHKLDLAGTGLSSVELDFNQFGFDR